MPPYKDLTGCKINNWNIIEFKGLNKHSQSLWLCECDCPKKTQRVKTTSQIKQRGNCGCKNVENLKEQQFGRWLVISDPIYKNDRIYFLCKCSCEEENICEVRSDNLKNGTSTSCGCWALETRTKHGLSRERITNIWYDMIYRCTNKETKSFKNYGARGISVCEEWSDNNPQGLINFTNWAIVSGYKDNLSIERINVDDNYYPDNCTWITMAKQARNKTNTIYFDIDTDENIKLIDLVEKSDINRDTILRRYKNGVRDTDTLLLGGNINNTSGVIGVSFSNSQNNWRPFININKKRIELGRKKNKRDAIIARLEAEKMYFGDLAPQINLFNEYGISMDTDEVFNVE